MNKPLTRALSGAAAVLWVTPSAVAAHAGHAGDHGWLYGAVQPLLSIDHALAGIFVAGLGAVVSVAAAAWFRDRKSERRRT